jgi:RimJ/RimL family protein N-acetyltransferase
MKFILSTLTEKNARNICSWNYDGIYSVYNMPSWEKAVLLNLKITQQIYREKEFYSIVKDEGELIGYFRIFNATDMGEMLGIGLIPSLCGKGLGLPILETIKKFACSNLNCKKLTLEVRTFNKRAIRCYEKAGFHVTKSYSKEGPKDSNEFYLMEINL